MVCQKAAPLTSTDKNLFFKNHLTNISNNRHACAQEVRGVQLFNFHLFQNLKIDFSSSGFVSNFTNLQLSKMIPLLQQPKFYTPDQADKQPSGAYIFRPKTNSPSLVSRSANITFVRVRFLSAFASLRFFPWTTLWRTWSLVRDSIAWRFCVSRMSWLKKPDRSSLIGTAKWSGSTREKTMLSSSGLLAQYQWSEPFGEKFTTFRFSCWRQHWALRSVDCFTIFVSCDTSRTCHTSNVTLFQHWFWERSDQLIFNIDANKFNILHRCKWKANLATNVSLHTTSVKHTSCEAFWNLLKQKVRNQSCSKFKNYLHSFAEEITDQLGTSSTRNLCLATISLSQVPYLSR